MLAELSQSPSGTVLITAADHTIRKALPPNSPRFLPQCLDIKVELYSDNLLTDFSFGRFNTGVRLGKLLAQDKIAVRTSFDIRFPLIATRIHFAERELSQKPNDLPKHNCINMHLPTHGCLWAWSPKRKEAR